MELELMKKSWAVLDKKIQQAVTLNEKLIENIISSRATTTIESIKRLYTFFYTMLIVEFIFIVAILFGNPFDFTFNIQFIPYVLLLSGVTIAFVNLLRISAAIRALSPAVDIGEYLRGIILVYDRNKKFEKWFGVILLSVGLLIPFSFLPQKMERVGYWSALGDIVVMVAITLLLYFLAFKFGAFKNRHKIKLEKDLADWNELKRLSNDLQHQ
jgi:hypothetical protein